MTNPKASLNVLPLFIVFFAITFFIGTTSGYLLCLDRMRFEAAKRGFASYSTDPAGDRRWRWNDSGQVQGPPTKLNQEQ